jgi:hypothetical protein
MTDNEKEHFKITNIKDIEFPFTQFLCEKLFNLHFKNEKDYVDFNFYKWDKRLALKELQYLRGVGENYFYIDTYSNKNSLCNFNTLYDFDESNCQQNKRLNYHLSGGILQSDTGIDQFHYFNHVMIYDYIISVINEPINRMIRERFSSSRSKKSMMNFIRLKNRYISKIKNKLKLHYEIQDDSIWIIDSSEGTRHFKCYLYANKNTTSRINLRNWQKDTENLALDNFVFIEKNIEVLKEKTMKFTTDLLDKFKIKEDEIKKNTNVIDFIKPLKSINVQYSNPVDRLSLYHKYSMILPKSK